MAPLAHMFHQNTGYIYSILNDSCFNNQWLISVELEPTDFISVNLIGPYAGSIFRNRFKCMRRGSYIMCAGYLHIIMYVCACVCTFCRL